MEEYEYIYRVFKRKARNENIQCNRYLSKINDITIVVTRQPIGQLMIYKHVPIYKFHKKMQIYVSLFIVRSFSKIELGIIFKLSRQVLGMTVNYLYLYNMPTYHFISLNLYNLKKSIYIIFK